MRTEKKILLVLDNGIIASDIKNMLESGGFEVCGFANTLMDAFSLFLSKQPNLIILDVAAKPMLSSLEFVKSVKRIRPCPIIYLTLENDADFINEFIKSSLDGYIVKPISGYHLVKATKRVLMLNQESASARI